METPSGEAISRKQFILQSFKGWKQWVVVTMLGLPVTIFTVVYPAIYEQFRLPVLVDLMPYQKWFIVIAIWYAITIILIVMIFIEGSRKYTVSLMEIKDKEARELAIKNKESELELIKIRHDLRMREQYKIVNIPDTLRDISDWYRKTSDEKKTIQVDTETSQCIITEFFNIENIKEVIELKPLSHKTVNIVEKRIRKRMGMKKQKDKVNIEWARRIYVVMDNNKVGLMRAENREYLELAEKLKAQTHYISETKLYHLVWDYVDNAYAAFSLKVFLNVGNIKTALRFFPFNVRSTIEQLDDKLERATGSGIAQIKHILEKYESGESL